MSTLDQYQCVDGSFERRHLRGIHHSLKVIKTRTWYIPRDFMFYYFMPACQGSLGPICALQQPLLPEQVKALGYT